MMYGQTVKLSAGTEFFLGWKFEQKIKLSCFQRSSRKQTELVIQPGIHFTLQPESAVNKHFISMSLAFFCLTIASQQVDGQYTYRMGGRGRGCKITKD